MSANVHGSPTVTVDYGETNKDVRMGGKKKRIKNLVYVRRVTVGNSGAAAVSHIFTVPYQSRFVHERCVIRKMYRRQVPANAFTSNTRLPVKSHEQLPAISCKSPIRFSLVIIVFSRKREEKKKRTRLYSFALLCFFGPPVAAKFRARSAAIPFCCRQNADHAVAFSWEIMMIIDFVVYRAWDKEKGLNRKLIFYTTTNDLPIVLAYSSRRWYSS